MRQKAIVSWSGGKDGMLALHEARSDYDIVGLLTTVTEEYDRVSMHGVRTRLLEQQTEALGLPLEKVLIPPTCVNAEYEARMGAALARYRAAGVSAVLCGDLFLEDIRRYREEKLFAGGLTGVFPLWGRDTGELARRLLALGFRAVLCCVDTRALAAEFAGRLFDEALLADLPPGVDPCGENGEFHTFVFDGPGFRRPVPFMLGERTLRDQRFAFRDLLPTD
jgi:uncharacterized protein (TIGR00290 family)